MEKNCNFSQKILIFLAKKCIFGSLKLFSGAKIDFFAVFEIAKKCVFALMKMSKMYVWVVARLCTSKIKINVFLKF